MISAAVRKMAGKVKRDLGGPGGWGVAPGGRPALGQIMSISLSPCLGIRLGFLFGEEKRKDHSFCFMLYGNFDLCGAVIVGKITVWQN